MVGSIAADRPDSHIECLYHLSIFALRRYRAMAGQIVKGAHYGNYPAKANSNYVSDCVETSVDGGGGNASRLFYRRAGSFQRIRRNYDRCTNATSDHWSILSTVEST